MQTTKRILSALLALCLIFGQFPALVFAAESAATVASGTCGSDLTWVFDDTGTLTISGTGTMNDYTYTAFQTNAPWGSYWNQITHVVIEPGVTSIGKYAFLRCTQIVSMSLADTITEIGYGAFEACTALLSVELPDSVSTMGSNVFEGCTSLQSVKFSAGLSEIPSSTFLDCEALVNVEIPSNITSIGNAAFSECRNLVSVSIPETVTSIGSHAFSDCWSLAQVNIPRDLTVIDNGAFRECKALTSIVIPEGVTSIGSYAFAECALLTSIVIPDQVTSIDAGAFSACSALENVTFGSAVQTIGEKAFSSCSSLQAVILPESVTSIGKEAFSGCKSMPYVSIGSNVASIGSQAFHKCASLLDIDVSPSNAYYYSDDRGVLFNKAKTIIHTAPAAMTGHYEVPEGVVSVDNYAFYGCDLESIDFSDTVTKIGDYAFYSSVNLTEVNFGNSVSSIGMDAFYWCTKLPTVTFPQSLKSLGDWAFSYCSKLKTAVFLGGCPYNSSNYIFYNTQYVTIYYPEDNASWRSLVKDFYHGNIVWSTHNPSGAFAAEIHSDVADKHILIRPRAMETDLASAIITGMNDDVLPDVTIACALGQSTIPAGGYEIPLADAAKQDIVLTKSGYRDYVLPAAVSATLIGEDGTNLYSLSANMQADRNDGKPYISTVFGRITGSGNPYEDLRSSSLTVVEGNTQDIIVTAQGFGEQDVTYYLSQDSARTISSSTGVFSGQDLYNTFDAVSTVYAYAAGSDGTITEPQAIKLKITEIPSSLLLLGENPEFSLLGSDFMKIKIPDDVFLLGGSEINMDALSVPIGMDIHGDEVKISIGMNIFSLSNDGEQIKTKDIFHDFKDMVVGLSDTVSDKVDSLASFRTAAEKFSKKNKFPIGKFDDPKESGKLSASVLGYLEGKIVNGELVVQEGLISIGGKFSIRVVAQGVIGPVPVYGYVGGGASLNASGKITRHLPNSAIPFEHGLIISVTPEITGGAGVGVNGALSLGIYGKGTLPVTIDCVDQHFTLGFGGEFGIEYELFIFQGKASKKLPQANVIDEYFGDAASAVTNQDSDGESAAYELAAEVAPRTYLQDTSRWLGSRNPAGSLMPNSDSATELAERGIQFRDLQTSIFSNSQPQLITVSDRMLMTWIADDASRDTYNRMCLVYSVYDPQTDTWSDPLPVWDDGYNDGYPRLAGDGDNIWVLWQKVCTTLTEENTAAVDTTLENTELCIARFDIDSGTFVEQQILTDNTQYEYSHSIRISNGKPIVYWAAAEENALNAAGCHSIFRWDSGIVTCPAQDLNHILSIDALDQEISYIMDTDGDVASTGDIHVYTVSPSGTVTFCSDSHMTGAPIARYGILDGEQTLFISDLANIYYVSDGNMEPVMEEARAIEGDLNILETETGTMLLWTERLEGCSELYAISYEDGVWTDAVRLSDRAELISLVSAVWYHDQLTGVCNTSSVAYDQTTGLYTVTQTDLSMFRGNSFTDISVDSYLTLDEAALEPGTDAQINVTVYNNGTDYVDALTFTVTDTFGTNSVQTVSVGLASGSSADIDLVYPVPESYGPTVLTVTAAAAEDDMDPSDNTVSVNIGIYDLSIRESSVENRTGGYLLKAVVENQSLVDAENVTLRVLLGSEDGSVLKSVELGTLDRETFALAEVLLKESTLTFDENGTAKVYLKLFCDGDEVAGAHGQICIVAEKPARTNCLHPVQETVDEKMPSCTEPGHSAYDQCLGCGEILTVKEEYPAVGHSYESVVTAPGCVDQGYTTHTCTACGDSYSDSYVDAVGHSYEATVTEPVCDQSGYTTHTCTVCADSYTDNYISGPGHSYESTTVEPTCTEKGYILHTCSVCAYSYSDSETAALGHSYSDGVCQRCGLPNPALIGSGQTGDVNWRLTSDGVLIISGQGAMADYGILEEKPWSEFVWINSIVVEEGVTSIGAFAFTNCGNITEFHIPASVTTIGGGAFSSCYSLQTFTIAENNTAFCTRDNLLLSADGTKLIAYPAGISSSAYTVPDYVTTICAYALSYTDIRELYLPDSVRVLENYALANIFGLSKVSFGNGLETIGGWVIQNNPIQEVHIPASVTNIDPYAFYGCTYLRQIAVSEENTAYCSVDGVLFSKDMTLLHTCPILTGLDTLVIPKSVTAIGAIAECSVVCNICFLGDAPAIGSTSFEGTTAAVTYPAENATWTESTMLSYGGNLTWYPDTTPLQFLTHPADVTVLENNWYGFIATAVGNVPEYHWQYRMSDAEAWADWPEGSSHICGIQALAETDGIQLRCVATDASGNTVFSNPATLTVRYPKLENGLNAQYTISDLVLGNDGIYRTPDGRIVHIGLHNTADGGNRYWLGGNTLYNYVTAYGSNYFDLTYWDALVALMDEEGYVVLTEQTLQYLITTVTGNPHWGETVDHVRFYLFYDREISLTTVASGWSGATEWSLTSDGVMTIYGSGNMKNYGWDIERPWAEYADQITDLVIEEGVTAVGSGAFKDMTALESVTLPASGLNKIGIAAFYGCTSLKEIYIPDGIYTIWEYTFKNCTALETVRLPKTLIKIDQGAFEACTSLSELFLPTNVGIIGGWSFKGCTGMKLADMQWADATEIRAGAFKNCTALTEIILPANIQTLGDSCFYGVGATSFTVPETVTTIADWCFARSALEEIFFAGSAPAIGTGAFNKITLTAYYPAGNATWTADNMLNYGGTVTWEEN